MARHKPARVLATVLFTDIVSSTELAGLLGDRSWQDVVSRHNELVRRELKRFGGRERNTAGDGFFATFTEPAAAIRCAAAITQVVRELGIEVRAGIHVGEVEVIDGKLEGIAVNIAARVVALAGPGRLLVSRTTRDLVAGTRFDFVDRGVHQLKGVPGTWRLFELSAVEGVPLQRPLDPEEAARRRSRIPATPLAYARRRSIRMLVVALLGLAVVAGVYMAFGMRRSLSPMTRDGLARLDPASGEIRAARSIGSEPTDVAVGAGWIWAVSFEAGTVTMLRYDSEDLERSTATGGRGPAAVAVDGDWVWVLNALEPSIVRIDARNFPATKAIHLGPGAYVDLAADRESVWATNETSGTLTRLDVTTGVVTLFEIPEGLPPKGVTVGGGFVWVVAGDELLRMATTGNDLKRFATLRYPGARVAYGAGAVWVTHMRDDHVSRVDLDTTRPSAIRVGDAPVDVAVRPDGAWVTNSLDGTVTWIDPTGRGTETYEVGGSPAGITADRDWIWVAVRARRI